MRTTTHPGDVQVHAPARTAPLRRLGAAEWAAIAALVAAAIPAAGDGRPLWGDGACFFDTLVAQRGGFQLPDFGRQHARYVAEWPAVLLLAAGLRNGFLLTIVFGLEHLLLVPAGLLGALLIAPRDAWCPRLAAFVAAGLGVVISMFAVSETLVLLAVALPMLAALYLRPREPGLLLLAALLHLVAVRTYELYPVLALLVAFAAMRQRSRKDRPTPFVRWLWALQLLLVAVGLAMTARSFLIGGRVGSYTLSTIQTLGEGARYAPVQLLLVGGTIAFLTPLLPAPWRSGGTWLAVLVVGTGGILPWVAPGLIDPERAFLTRVAGTAAGVALFGACCALPERAPGGAGPGSSRWKLALGPLLVLGVLSWDVASTVQWRGYRDAFRKQIAHYDGCGVVPPEAWRSPAELKPLRHFMGYWQSPYLVGALAPEGTISVVLADPGDHGVWLMGGPPDLTAIGKSWASGDGGCSQLKRVP